LTEPTVLTVKELTQHIKGTIERSPVLTNVWLRAEISNFTHHSRGHMYFTLKDETARIKAVMFAGHNRYLKFVPKNGLKIIANGEVNVYERDGQYQLYVKEMQPDGIGALYQAFEELKEKLGKQGWFAAERKKTIPKVPRKIGVITSPTGAAVRDILTTLKRRFPISEVVVFPVLVQGERAPTSIARAIDVAHQEHGIDVLIVGRGGGSIEELWAFNEEVVAKAIFLASIPVISAVGHETDYTIADFVADLRAPTPTAAAELSVPVLAELKERVSQAENGLKKALIRNIRDKRKELEGLRNRYAFKYPQQLVVQKEQDLDTLLQRLQKSAKAVVEQQNQRFNEMKRHLDRLKPQEKLAQAKQNHSRLHERLKREISMQLDAKKKQHHYMVSKLDALSPLKIMTKGYSLVYNQDKSELYKSVRQIEPGQAITLSMRDGSLDCQVWGIKEENRDE
jgi:exodeoxyribonuclease VII large subunit